jgi:DNA-binding SARP family transcriptional activator
MIHRLPDFIMTVMACWLGLSLWVRAPHDRTAAAFAWLCLNLAVYGMSAVLSLLTTRYGAALMLDRAQLIATLTAPVAFLQFVLALVSAQKPARWQRLALLAFYALALALGTFAIFGPMDLSSYRDYQQTGEAYRPWAPWGETRFPGPWLNGLWAAQRVLPLLLGLYLMAEAYRRHDVGGPHTGRQRLFFAIAATVGVLGAIEATLARIFQLTPAVGRTFIALALAALAYAVLAYRSLLPPRVAQRAFVYSLLGGLITLAYVSLLLGLEWLTRMLLGVGTPVVTAIALVALVALFGPLREWLGAQLDKRFFRREFDYDRLIDALSSDLLSGSDIGEQFEPLLSSVCRASGAQAGLVAVRQGQGLHVVAAFGLEQAAAWDLRDAPIPTQPLEAQGWQHWPAARLVLPLIQEKTPLGVLALGPRRSGQPYGEGEQQLLRAVANYLGVAIAHQRVREQEQRSMALLAEQSRALREQQTALAQLANAALDRLNRAVDSSPPAQPQSGMRVFCLGPLRVERDGEPLTRWGGEKAGTHQAEALFAFLFDRRGRGLSKDEIEELIWPELPIDKADTAFHRTLSGLRRTLEPNLRRGNQSRAIPYQRDRYWLEPALIAWADLDEFARLLEEARQLAGQGQDARAIERLQQAAALYRGPYMDDCPFFGDSAYVEERRAALQAEYVECLLTLGGLLERQGRADEALAYYRRALAAADGAHARAEERIARLRA